MPSEPRRRLQYGIAALILIQAVAAVGLGIWRGFGVEGVLLILGLAAMATFLVAVGLLVAPVLPFEWSKRLTGLSGPVFTAVGALMVLYAWVAVAVVVLYHVFGNP